ncbi:MAG: DNA mismatch endonuclease Vsr [Mesorhizobium sp.]|nr:MAG: DNA mismatch endonuclease Vsr [Mesorhizobium sp.]TKC02167.1 MAG: DNA mismatch endonuclease Vsr [Mesorhizobium sp.]
MSAIRGRDTKPELHVRRLLHRLGYRFRLHVADLPGRPDIVFRARRKVIEVRGCFWHQHESPACPNNKLPATRTTQWSRKLEGNVHRDARNKAALALMGWDTLVIWECDVRKFLDLSDILTTFLGPVRSKPR